MGFFETSGGSQVDKPQTGKKIFSGTRPLRARILRMMSLGMFFLLCGQVSMAAFNETVAGARAQGMGGAFTAVADDSTALYWNPAGLSQMKRHEAMFMYADKYDLTTGPSFTEQFFTYSSPTTNYGTFGFHYSKEGSDSILAEKRMGLSYGKRVGSKFSLGMNLNSLTLSPAINSSQRSSADPSMTEQNSLGIDLGFLLNITDDAKIGLSVKNLGASFGVVTENTLDTIVKFGAAVRTSEKLLMAMDANFKENTDENKDNEFQLSGGMEYNFTPQVAFRAGFNKGDLTAGCGFRAKDWNLDYAFLNHDIGNTHRVSFSMRFGAGENEEDPDSSHGDDLDYVSDPGPANPVTLARVRSAGSRAANAVAPIPGLQKSPERGGAGPDGPVEAFKGDGAESAAAHQKVAVVDVNSGKVVGESEKVMIEDVTPVPQVLAKSDSTASGDQRLREWTPLPKMVKRNEEKLSLAQVPDHLRTTGADGDTLVSLKYLANALKYHYSYDNLTRTASLFKLGVMGNDTFVRFKAGSSEADRNRKPVSLGSKAELIKGNLAVPFARACEILGAQAVN